MEVIRDLNKAIKKDTVVTIGTFDGVHIGHKKIIDRLVALARDKDLYAAVLTFFPHPRMVLQRDANIKLINTIDERSKRFDAHGIDYLFVKSFTPEFSRMSAESFVKDLLVDTLNARYVIVGYDHHFGRNRAANIEDLREFGEIYGFEVIEIPAQEIDEVAVSSTKIRKALAAGDLKTANAFLGYSFMLNGTVVKGKGLGKELTFPTANLNIQESYKLVPKNGVYVVRSMINEREVFGMMNIGTKPTVNDDDNRFIEVHFFDLEADLYGQQLEIEIMERLRDEEKFESIQALQSQLNLDRQQARNFIESYND